MRTTKWTGLLFAAFLVLSCDTKKIGKCTSQADCPEEGAYCDNETALCVLNCETRECDPGHFCDLSTKQCVTECPYACPTPPENATITCEDPCVGFTCNTGFHVCDPGRCASDTDANACGAECTPCPAPDNGTATCVGESCGFTCNDGYRLDGTGGCIACPAGDCSTFYPVTSKTYGTVQLMWQGCAAGYMGNDCTDSTGTSPQMTWDAANDFCENSTWQGYENWRLPDLGELKSILLQPYKCDTSPCIDSTAFPNTTASYFWSSWFPAGNSSCAGAVSFGSGNEAVLPKAVPHYVRCVRSGP